ncbi:helix-turn-helix domain-containing protein [Tropicimonas marinistellae]|uniref:helix-turn-helix domain-containing protein n=1 Tax=Tropicimonas marinistellae TaxID=1739787 RepID=UPI00082D7682|nr:helix-turn-helix domain-containing protein [Tropicimonas marinistellae]
MFRSIRAAGDGGAALAPAVPPRESVARRIGRIAAAAGLDPAALRAIVERHGAYGGRMESLREITYALPRDVAVDFLLDIIDQFYGDTPEIGRFPGVKLEPRLRQAFCALYAAEGRIVTYRRMFYLLYGDTPESDEFSARAPQWCVARMRKRLRHLTGFEIETMTREGYRLTRAPGYRFPWEDAA